MGKALRESEYTTSLFGFECGSGKALTPVGDNVIDEEGALSTEVFTPSRDRKQGVPGDELSATLFLHHSWHQRWRCNSQQLQLRQEPGVLDFAPLFSLLFVLSAESAHIVISAEHAA
jgi:hypothetical protein